MHLRKQKRSNGRIYLSVVQSYRTPEGKTRSKTIRSLGYLDELERTREDPVAYFQAEIDQMNLKRSDPAEPVVVTFPRDAVIPLGEGSLVEAGAAIVSGVLRRSLRLDDFFAQPSVQRCCPPEAAEVLGLLAWNRIAHPATFGEAGRFAAMQPTTGDISLQDVHRVVKHLANLVPDCVAWMNESLKPLRDSDDATCYCLVTNHYLDSERPGKGLGRLAWEDRPNSIVQLAVLVDGRGLPLDFEVYEGSFAVELSTLPAAESIASRHPKKTVVVVAGKVVGSNNADLVPWMGKGRGFILAQSLRKGPRVVLDWVLDQEGYQGGAPDGFKAKERVVKRSIPIKDASGEDGVGHLSVKEVSFWHRESRERRRFERYSIVKRNESVFSHGEPSVAASNPIRAVRGTGEARIGEVGEHLWQVYWDKIAADELLDGYHCLVTSLLDTPGIEAVSIYQNLRLVDDMFKIPLGEWADAPGYLSRTEYLHAHFLICYLAATIVQIMYVQAGHAHADESILHVLASLVGRQIDPGTFFFDYRTPLSSELSQIVGIDLSHPVMTNAQIRQLFKRAGD